MTLKYSASANGFYDTKLHRLIPDDAVSIRATRHAQLLAQQAGGAVIRAMPDGRPGAFLTSITPAGAHALLVRQIRHEAKKRIEAQLPIWKQLNALRDGSDPGFWKIDAIRAASNLIEAQMRELTSVAAITGFPVKDNPLWPLFDDAQTGLSGDDV